VDVVQNITLAASERNNQKPFSKPISKKILSITNKSVFYYIITAAMQKSTESVKHIKYIFQKKQLEVVHAILQANKRVKKVYTILISTLLISAIASSVMAGTEDNVIITFNPDGDIDIDVSLAIYNFSNVLANEWSNTTGNAFLLYNNGTVSMDTRIKTNATTDEGDMTLDAAGTPSQDEYSIETKGFDSDGFLDSSYVGDFDSALSPNDTKGFDICLLIGTNLSANHSWQTTTITFQGTQS
jgi:hypothetical protein